MNRGTRLLCLLGMVMTFDGVWLVLGGPAQPVGRGFQRATGGVGLSSAVSPAWSFFAVDPRSEPACENELWPLPGGACYSPDHGMKAGQLPPLPVKRPGGVSRE